ncbi:VOC family protein [Vibrio sp. SCSIO 43137]|uniref:VOC family protein n=1 Tax=Vibrio sp. SCSIO 43137 TaxID=3021011 RepID=UPI0023081FF1|nr:VOC family protein [Vibrio sp. SCSIO 43137]WCE28763.1 VOC family protein [Vibrio sp. SCSIO 43137]
MSNPLLTNDLQPFEMIKNVQDFATKVQALATDIGVNIQPLQADHIALRINDQKVAEAAHTEWLSYGRVISQAVINGRPIIVLEFSQPLAVAGWKIECLELPYPAAGKRYPREGWEHIEFVVESDSLTAEEFLNDLKNYAPALDTEWDKLADKGIKTKLSSPKGEGERLANPTVAFKREGVCIKFHPHSLKKVVESEQA